MAPLLVNVKNSSSKPRDLYTSKGKHFHISNGETVTINHHLDGTVDRKIQINTTDVRRYLLKYDSADKSSNKIMINDTLGRSIPVEDTLIWAKNEEEDLYIEICEETIKISTSEKNLRLYKSGGELSAKYYQTVVANNEEAGGITIKGVDANVGGIHNKEDEGEGED